MCDNLNQWIYDWCVSLSCGTLSIARWPKLVFRSSTHWFSCLRTDSHIILFSTVNFITDNLLSSFKLQIQKSVLIFFLLFINLFLLPNLSHAFRVPYRYPHYPLLHKEYPNNSPAGPAPNEVEFVEVYARDNAKVHHTANYEIIDNQNPALVIRRGDPFYVAVRLNRNYDQQRDKLRLEFMFGPRPQIGKGTLIYLPITNNKDFTKDSSKWDARIHKIHGQTLTLQVHVPASVSVGVWRLRLSTKQQGSRVIKSYQVKENIYVLFNAWCKEDGVYLGDESKRREYVLNDVGKIYIGSHSRPKGRRWVYGQFADAVLPAVMFMLERTRLDYAARANPVKVVRAIAAMVNSHDDNGLLVGNWSGNYNDGNAPWQWTGSSAIFEQYLKSNGVPVKFGQCWVFAGTATTMCRALGIPARTVSAFVSAHDTDDSLTVDKFFSKTGESISDVNSDSIWNFHVWTDAWMARPDLPPGYGGWQVIDGTPQETSDVSRLYQTGPASLEAIKRGEVGLAYDVPFVFSEINADVVHWQLDETSELGWRKIKVNKYHVGRKIFTKRVGIEDDSNYGVGDAEDIIDLYKFKEGSEEERMAVLNAARGSGLSFLFEIPPPGKEEIDFDLVDIEKVLIGNAFYVQVNLGNRGGNVRTIQLFININSVYYTGILARKIKQERQIVVLQPYQKDIIRIRVNPDDYLDKLVDYSMMKVYAIATVKETQQTWSEEDDFAVEKPHLNIVTNSDIQVGVEFTVEIQFTNPINRVLEDCSFTIEGPGIARPMTIQFRNIQAGESITHILRFMPQKSGPRTIVVVFHSRQLIDVVGSKQVNVLH